MSDPSTLEYERVRRSFWRLLRRGVIVVVLFLILAVWPTSQFIEVAALQEVNWVWCSSAVKIEPWFFLNRTGIMLVVQRDIITTQPGGMMHRYGMKGDRSKELRLGRGVYHARRGFGPTGDAIVPVLVMFNIDIDSPPLHAVSVLGMHVGWHSSGAKVPPRSWPHPEFHSVDGGRAMAPSWLLALISLVSGLLLWRKFRQWKRIAVLPRPSNLA